VRESNHGDSRLRRGRASDLSVWRPNWRTKIVAFVSGGLCMLLFLLSGHGYAWGGAITSAGAAVIVPVVGLRQFWHQGRFWITVAFLAVAQVPLVLIAQPKIGQGGLATMLAFGAVDCLLVCVTILLTAKSTGQ
jgi:hypothetical protein